MAQMVKRLPTMRETRVQSLDWEDLLEKEMAAHSSILAWKIPWTEEPGRLRYMGSQRIRHDCVHTCIISILRTNYLHFTPVKSEIQVGKVICPTPNILNTFPDLPPKPIFFLLYPTASQRLGNKEELRCSSAHLSQGDLPLNLTPGWRRENSQPQYLTVKV